MLFEVLMTGNCMKLSTVAVDSNSDMDIELVPVIKQSF